MKHFVWPLIVMLVLFQQLVLASNDSDISNKVTVNGYVKDASNGEELIGVTILVAEKSRGTATNVYGFYSVSLEPGHYTLIYSFVGYKSIEKKLELNENLTIDVELQEESVLLNEVVVTSRKPNENITRNEMSVARLDIKSIQRIPALMGEVDVIKAIQLLPGVQSTAEGTSGFSVRGGAVDHNLILLDEATVYNASHLMGFFSVFNNDAIKDVKLYKGDIPASSGGRLASLLDVRMKDGNSKNFSLTGGIGTISSRLTMEGPLVSENTTFMVSGRRTYADVFLPLAPNEDIRDNTLFFYDLNVKLSHRINDKHRLFLSGYYGRDIFGSSFARFGFGNQTTTLRWNYIITPKLFLNTTAIYSNYNYYLGTADGEPTSFRWNSFMNDYSLKFDFTYFLNTNNTFKFGGQSIYHEISPAKAKGVGEEALLGEFILPENLSFEHGFYVMNEQTVNDNLSLKYGLRLSVLQNAGNNHEQYIFDENYEVVESVYRKKGEIFNTYSNLEPRFGINYTINEKNSVKSSYSRTVQYIQQATNGAAGTPLDIWFTASPNIKPQVSDQFAVGYFRNFLNNALESSVEFYYKDMQNVVDFKDFANLLMNDKLEGELRIGTAESYGMEFLTNFNYKNLNGWVSYTFSRVFRTIDEINGGEPYSAISDKPHDIAIVANYEVTPQFSVSANWIYSTGIPATFPTGRYEILGTIIPLYSSRNNYRFPDYHRLDVALIYKPKRNGSRKWQSEWNLSIYNAYNRKNAWAINFVQDENNPSQTYAEKTYLFSILPSLTYNFKF
ncbi:MAG TPA: TonB-dependent receptor [Tenuifilaceae bacterium]|nr:TonB-dependent receptor [Tenuifilaceae bacterium]HPE18079.1 TonB-dependent receptor [Tenuifilaceae bacterium]HPJ45449.1 TonB-dependent receptor [Tenuifilaceae bacterium]HPQ34066.1 TonB-dependent receptor [Tenuifilaceae bacterium]HRX68039.1 TonB-dependent receptor [Tenuifilaceae bacterium]